MNSFERDNNGVPNLGKPKPQIGFTEMEQKAINLTIELANAYAQIVGDGPSRDGDMAEFVAHLHPIQNAIMSQLAHRIYPQFFRGLGGVVGVAPRP